ncbi:MAG: hypothetical protein AB9860_02510 [Methanomassiliicoccales archaeon]
MTSTSSTDIGTPVGNESDKGVSKYIFNEPERAYTKPYYITEKEDAMALAKKLALSAN